MAALEKAGDKNQEDIRTLSQMAAQAQEQLNNFYDNVIPQKDKEIIELNNRLGAKAQLGERVEHYESMLKQQAEELASMNGLVQMN